MFAGSYSSSFNFDHWLRKYIAYLVIHTHKNFLEFCFFANSRVVNFASNTCRLKLPDNEHLIIAVKSSPVKKPEETGAGLSVKDLFDRIQK